MMNDIKQCIVVTGASRGIGAAIARALAEAGHAVACVSRSGALPEARTGGAARLFGVRADVAQAGAMAEACREIAGRGHRIAGLVNNAGVHLESPAAQTPLDQWHAVMDTNATATLLAAQAVHPHLVEAGGGLIVNIGSFFDKLGVKRNVAYCASKAAVGAITRCLAVEWAAAGIRVIDVAPGYIQTDLNAEMLASGPLRAYLQKRIPSGEPGTAEDVGRFVAALYAQPGGFLSGETIYLDGAQGIAH